MPKKLLLADDSVTIQKVVGITFANEDIELVTVDNGDAALEQARATRPDLVLADVGMPGLNGYELSAALRAEPDLAAVPVLLLTGTFETYDEERAHEVGASDHIAKPFEAQALVDQVYRLLAQSAGAQPAAAPSAPAAALAPESMPLPDPAVEDEWEPPSGVRMAPMSEDSLAQLPNSDFAPLDNRPAPQGSAQPTPPARAAVLPPAAPPPAGANSAADPFSSLEFADPTPEPSPNSGIFGDGSGSAAGSASSSSSDAAAPQAQVDDRSLPPAEPPAFDFDEPTAASATTISDAPTRPRRLPEAEPSLGDPAASLPPAEAPAGFSFADTDSATGSSDGADEYADSDEDNNATAFLDPLAAAPAPAADPEPPELPSDAGDTWTQGARRPAPPPSDLPELPPADAALQADPDEDFAGAATVVAPDPLAFAGTTTGPCTGPALSAHDDPDDPLAAPMPTPPADLPEFAAPPPGDPISAPSPSAAEAPEPVSASAPEPEAALEPVFEPDAPPELLPEPELELEAELEPELVAAPSFAAEPERATQPEPEPVPQSFPPLPPAAEARVADLPGAEDPNATTAPAIAPQPEAPAPVGLDSSALHESIEKVAFEAFGSLSEELVREFTARVEAVVWEVVPPLAERLIREELQRLKGDVD